MLQQKSLVCAVSQDINHPLIVWLQYLLASFPKTQIAFKINELKIKNRQIVLFHAFFLKSDFSF